MHRVTTIILLFALGALVLVPRWRSVSPWDPYEEISDVIDSRVTGSVSSSGAAPAALDEHAATLALGELRHHYYGLVSSIDANMNLQAVILLIGLVLTVTRSSRVLEVVGVPVSVPWLHLILPWGALWVWLHWGFLVNAAMRDRATIEAITSAAPGGKSLGLVRYAQSLSLSDSGFMDTWFYSWRRDHVYELSDQSFASWCLSAITGLFIGAFHAVMIAVLLRGAFRFKRFEGLTNLCRLSILPIAASLILSHVFFYLGAGHNHQQVLIAVFASAGLIYLVWYTPHDVG